MLETEFPIDFGAAASNGRQERDNISRLAMEARDRIRAKEKGGDFWSNDPHFKEICSELEAEEAGRVWEDSEAIMEECEREFARIQEAPPRHFKKKK